ncbi:MAG: DoxX family protein [Acidobacteriota bacterium]|nr:DoxX family protein [Acidobacteriota bacterium]
MSIETIAQNLPALFAALLVSILFIQSGLDKIFDRRGNLEWLTGHFSKTFLAPLVPILLVTITVMELAAGVLCATGIVYFLFTSSAVLIFVASVIAAFSIIALFFGQRIAKDYAGAAILIPYFILVAILMYLTSPFSKAS